MPLRKIKDADVWENRQVTCHHPEHNPPTHIVLSPGSYEYECPGCGRKIRFVVGLGPMLREPKWPPENAFDVVNYRPKPVKADADTILYGKKHPWDDV